MSENSHSLSLVRNDSLIQENSGYAHIKKEFILRNEENSKENKDISDNLGNENTDSKNGSFQNHESSNQPQPPCKKAKRTGRNKVRPKFKRVPNNLKLCHSFWALRPGEIPNRDRCPYPNCNFNHDIEHYLKDKPEDLSDICHNFETYGFCQYGITCRYGSKHIDGFCSKINEEKYKEFCEKSPFINSLDKEVKIKLRKKKYDFSRAQSAIKYIHGSKKETLHNSTDGNEIENKRLGPVSDEDLIHIRPEEKIKIDWNDKLYLAPLTTVGNLPFRRVCKRFGADITCSEMAVATCLLQGSNSEWALVKRHSSEDCYGVQLCGGGIDTMLRCAQLLDDQISMDFIDINMGCPIDLIYKQGAGSALMRRLDAVEKMVTGMNRVLKCPVTLKIRTGVYHNSNIAHQIIQRAKLWDVNLITLHGRSKEQRFVRLANWEYIDECAKEAEPMNFFGNGDILTFDDYQLHKNSTNVSGIMIARGALIKPWIFTEIKEKRNWDISSSERFDILKEYVGYGLEHWGSDSEGIEKTRRFLLEWLSFLYRYIPVGLLDQPQKMNQRPPLYFGRNDLETLMASRNVKDWIKISEMLLGPVPDDFEFLPKHKANSWN